MEGKRKFDYESAAQNEKKNEPAIQDITAKILQVIIGIIMAVLHMWWKGKYHIGFVLAWFYGLLS